MSTTNTMPTYAGTRYNRPANTTLRIGARVRMVGTHTSGTVETYHPSGRPELSSAWVAWDCGRGFSVAARNLVVVG